MDPQARLVALASIQWSWRERGKEREREYGKERRDTLRMKERQSERKRTIMDHLKERNTFILRERDREYATDEY